MENKLCQMCKKRPASLHVTQLLNNKHISVHLCHECAEQQGESGSPSALLMNYLSLASLAQEKVKVATGQKKVKPAQPSQACTGCQKTLEDFQETGRLGCAQCYKTFEKPLGEIIEKVQKSKQHRGKVPEISSTTYRTQQELSECKHRLRQAVGNEEFEEAARLRDRIRGMEESLL